MSAYQKAQQVEARKIVKLINNGLKTQLNEAVNCVNKAGEACGRVWNLVALNGNEILFEDVNSDQLFMANYIIKPEPKLNDIKPIEIVDEEKSDSFFDTCKILVESIESDNKKAIASAFNRMSLQRFTSKIIPESRQIKCKDGEIYKLPVSESRIFTSDDIKKIVAESKTHYTSGIILSEGKIVAYNSSNDKPKINAWIPRRAATRSMKNVALNAYNDPKFRSTIVESANLLAEGQIEEAAKNIGRLFQVDEEYTLLTESEMNSVVKNSLATAAIFNDKLASDLSTMAHKLNLKLNKKAFITEWKKIAKAAGSSILLENVNKLASAPNFERAHGKFMAAILETAGGRDTQITMLRTTLEKFANDVTGIKNDPGLSEKMNGLIEKLKSGTVDESTLFEAEDVVAAVGDELRDTETMDDFDMNEPDLSTLDDEVDDVVPDANETAAGVTGASQPVININSPLIQIGGTSGAPDANAGTATSDLGAVGDLGGGDVLDDLAGDVGGDETVDDVDTTGLGETGDAGQNPEIDPLASDEEEDISGFDALTSPDEEDDSGLFESRPAHYEMKSSQDDDRSGYPVKISEAVTNYGYKFLKEARLINQVVESMAIIAKVSKGKATLETIAESVISKLNISIPKKSRWQAIQEAVEAFEAVEEQTEEVVEDIDESSTELPFSNSTSTSVEKNSQLQSGKIPPQSAKHELSEDQIFTAHTNKMGPKKTDIGPTLEWISIGDKESTGVCEGVKFTIGHENMNQMVIKNSNGSATIPVPKPLLESALGSMNLAKTDPVKFNTWLAQITESIRPISELEEEDLDDDIDDYDESEDEDSDDMSPVGGEDDSEMDDMDMVDSEMDDMDMDDSEMGDDMDDMDMDDQGTEQDAMSELGIQPGDELLLVAPKSGVVVPVSVDGAELNETEHSEPDADDFGGPSDNDEDNESDDDTDEDGPDGPDTDEDGPPDSGSDESSEPDSDDDSDDSEELDDDSDDEYDESDESDDADESDDKPAFLKEAEESSEKPMSFIEKKIAERKAKKGTHDPKKVEGDKPIEEGPYDDYDRGEYDDGKFRGSLELNFFFHDNVWLDVNTDKPAPPVVQQIAARTGLTNAITSGKVQAENCLYDITINYESSSHTDPGDYITPSYTSYDNHITDANVSMEAGDTPIPVQLTPEEYKGLEEAYGDSLPNEDF